MQEVRKGSDYKLLEKCGLKIGFIGKIAFFTTKNRDYSLYQYIPT